jgi:phosphoribosylformylglycinamidine cyclo-ligase
MQEHGPIDDREAYQTLNMGVGFALYVNKADVGQVMKIAKRLGHIAWNGGVIEKGPKKVILKQLGIEYAADTLKIR